MEANTVRLGAGMKIAYCGGTWDILHAEHVSFFEWVSGRFDHVIAAVNTDEFVREFKKRNPIMCLEDRMRILKAVRWIDEVIVNKGGKNSMPSILASGASAIVTGA